MAHNAGISRLPKKGEGGGRAFAGTIVTARQTWCHELPFRMNGCEKISRVGFYGVQDVVTWSDDVDRTCATAQSGGSPDGNTALVPDQALL